ncbi:hypothetical protein QJS66_14560 [Kocuria rhizophila]|nr:hypothetical protein QJS66_14560 [Kocuria rhizophila]
MRATHVPSPGNRRGEAVARSRGHAGRRVRGQDGRGVGARLDRTRAARDAHPREPELPRLPGSRGSGRGHGVPLGRSSPRAPWRRASRPGELGGAFAENTLLDEDHAVRRPRRWTPRPHPRRGATSWPSRWYCIYAMNLYWPTEEPGAPGPVWSWSGSRGCSAGRPAAGASSRRSSPTRRSPRLEIARQWVCTVHVLHEELTAAAVSEATGNTGADLVIQAVVDACARRPWRSWPTAESSAGLGLTRASQSDPCRSTRSSASRSGSRAPWPPSPEPGRVLPRGRPAHPDRRGHRGLWPRAPARGDHRTRRARPSAAGTAHAKFTIVP